MKIYTYQEIRDKVESDLDLKEEKFITPDELLGYCNEAIHEAESEILGIYDEYFLTSIPLTLSVGVFLYALPSGIYAQKIRGMTYSLGSIQYPIKRVRGASKFDTINMIDNYGQQDDYMYILVNNTAGTQNQIRLTPPSREAGSPVTIWYLRNANRVPTAAERGIQPTDPNDSIQLATLVDIPEFYTFIIDFMKAKCMQKDMDPRLDAQLMALANQRKMMIDTLTQQVPDDDNTIMPDMTFYQQSS